MVGRSHGVFDAAGYTVGKVLDIFVFLFAGKHHQGPDEPMYKPRSTELWLICPSRQSITPAVRLLRDMFRKKARGILRQLIDRGILEDGALAC